MKTGAVAALILGLIGLLALPSDVIAKSPHASSATLNSGYSGGEYTLEFIPTQNAPAGAQGTMAIKTVNGDTIVHFSVKGTSPNTVYTIWIVFNQLTWDPKNPPTGSSVPSDPPPPTDSQDRSFPKEGNGVAPLARLDAAFTSGMGLDPGLVFVTNDNGDGEAHVKLDYNLIWNAPVGNKDIIAQCVPGPVGAVAVYNNSGEPLDKQGNPLDPNDPELNKKQLKIVQCNASSKKINVTTTWLRKYIAQMQDPATQCANYDASFGSNVQYWQCVDPATGLPRVYRFEFDHFRLANHPDDLTHGFIGGNGVDHWIDMVGRRCDLLPSVGAVCPP